MDGSFTIPDLLLVPSLTLVVSMVTLLAFALAVLGLPGVTADVSSLSRRVLIRGDLRVLLNLWLQNDTLLMLGRAEEINIDFILKNDAL